MAHQGFDSLTIDLEHGFAGFETALTMIQAIAGAGVTPLARAPWNEPGIIMRLLDAGCLGIICPMVNERAEAERFVGACRYPPQGYRSLGPTRAGLVYGSDYARTANARVITLAMVETAAALANLDATVEELSDRHVAAAYQKDTAQLRICNEELFVVGAVVVRLVSNPAPEDLTMDDAMKAIGEQIDQLAAKSPAPAA